MMLQIQWVWGIFEVELNISCFFNFILFLSLLKFYKTSKAHNYSLIFLDLANLFNQFYTKDLMNFLVHLEYLDHLDHLNHLDTKDIMDLNLLYFHLLNLVFL